jgi:macrolide transport system ATP-binding/permease protein
MLERFHTATSRLSGLLFGRHHDAVFDQEVQAHLAMLAEDNVRRGMTPDEAARQARVHFGGVAQIKEEQREKRGLPQIAVLFQDLRYAGRTLRKNPGFTLVAVLTLALGIGVNTTLFTAFDSVALKPLPVKDPKSLVRVMRWFESQGRGNGQYLFSYPEYVDYREANHSFSSLVAASMVMSVTSAADRLQAQLVSDNYFSELGLGTIVGRTFISGEKPVVVLSYPFWRTQFHGDPQAVGKTIRLNNTSFTIIGVTPEKFIGSGNPPQVPDLWAPLAMQPELIPGQDWLHEARATWFQLFGRLQPEVTVKQAQAQTMVNVRQFEAGHIPRDKTITITLEPATFFGETRDVRFQAFVALLMFVVGMILLIACANLANVLLARAAVRHREIGVRRALGASRARLIRQLLTESVLLSLLGGLAGLLFSIWASQLLWVWIQGAILAFIHTRVTLTVETFPDLRIFAYTLLVSIAAGIVFGLAPALQLSRADVASALRQEGSAFGQTLGRSRLRSVLLASQVAVSMIFLICAGLATRGLFRSQKSDPGFETAKVLAVGIRIDYATDRAKALSMQRRFVELLRGVPQVKSVALVDNIPLGGTWTPPVQADESHAALAARPGRTLANHVSAEYFTTLGIPIVHGRNFTERESETSPHLAIVSESTARTLWPGEDPLGKRAKLDMNFRGKWESFEVIGVAKDVRSANLSRVDPAYFYLPTGPSQFNNVLVRVEGDAKSARSAIHASLEAVDPSLASRLSAPTLDETVVAAQRLLTGVFVMFAAVLAGLAILLAGVGIYGVMSYLVSRRVREIGIRMAMGASASEVLGSVVLDGLRPVLYGAVLGLLGAGALSSALKSTLVFPGSVDFLYGASAYDPATFLGLTAFLAAVAALASAVPARRAIKVDPVVALRYE